MSTEQTPISNADVFKAIGHLEEATKVMTNDAITEAEDEEKIVGFFALVGHIIRHFLER